MRQIKALLSKLLYFQQTSVWESINMLDMSAPICRLFEATNCGRLLFPTALKWRQSSLVIKWWNHKPVLHQVACESIAHSEVIQVLYKLQNFLKHWIELIFTEYVIPISFCLRSVLEAMKTCIASSRRSVHSWSDIRFHQFQKAAHIQVLDNADNPCEVNPASLPGDLGLHDGTFP